MLCNKIIYVFLEASLVDDCFPQVTTKQLTQYTFIRTFSEITINDMTSSLYFAVDTQCTIHLHRVG